MISPEFFIKAPAKLNIRLKVVGRRHDGYHEIVTIMVPVDLYDFIHLKIKPCSGINLVCKGFSAPADETNLASRAASLFFSETKKKDGLIIDLIKNIPIGAGLGGGSSNAASVLKSLNNYYSNPLSKTEMHDLAVSLGADVPFFLECRPSVATGIGDILEPIDKWPNLYYLIIIPPVSVSTSWAYENVRLQLTTDEYSYINSVLKFEPIPISHILENDLEKVTSASFPIIETLKKMLLDAGAEGAVMSGSGSSVFGVFSSADRAKSAEAELRATDMGKTVLAMGI
ncbi:MAG: 4-(cytidine 5'-diphospho)-2-C-methyl-D-erythritol kinase [Deltaproteobacteria bacterium]|nr:4-(cytidine 5'-diphospho)-2-C-methyl-D-erythritol kinase [Deltaproteobacteria bacterium]